jgi:hypothetical protein
MTVCPWITDLAKPLCCDGCDWESVDPLVKQAAINWATVILWAATGRQFDECEQTVRPCGWNRCADGSLDWFGWGWSGSTWMPYLWNGVWFNCGCSGMCSCNPDCSVRLDGPVVSITEVTVDGDVVDPDTYFVYDRQWLTRVGPDCWPTCPDLNAAPGPAAGVFEVTYVRGRAVPADLKVAVGTLACQWIKACRGDSSCRITNSRIIAMSRQGTDFQFVAPEDLLRLGLTGVGEVDMLIAAYNPNGLHAPLRVFAPELVYPRVVTWP